jgi:hypothetical protein
MDLTLQRDPSVDGTTSGKLFLGGTFLCFTLEPEIRTGPKVLDETAIPPGRYKILIYPSPKFHRMVPKLENVPGVENVEIHMGNSVADTEACILVGLAKRGPTIESSRAALDQLMAKLAPAQANGEPIWLTVQNHPTETRTA